MIGEIRNPWIRRTLLVVLAPILFAVIGILGAIVTIIDDTYLFRDAWRGPVK